MSSVVYGLRGPGHMPVMKDSRPLQAPPIAVSPRNATTRKPLDVRTSQGQRDMVIPGGLGGVSRISVSISVRAERVEDKALAAPAFWHIPECNVAVRELRIAKGCSVDAHIAWNRPMTMGRDEEGAPTLTGTLHATVHPPAGKPRAVGMKLRYDPLSNQIRFG